MTLARRDFLKVMRAAGLAGACAPWLASCQAGPRDLAATSPGVAPPRGAPESWIVSTCGACPGGCGIRARLVSGRLVGIAGNPLHPINRGGLCPLGLAGVHAILAPSPRRSS